MVLMGAAMSDVLRIRGLHKKYPGFELEGIDLSVESGAIAGLVGRNGAGKTTIIKSVLGLVSPTSGTVEINGEEVLGNPAVLARELRDVGVVFDTCPFPEYLKISVLAPIGRAHFPEWRDEAFFGYLTQFGVNPKKRVKELSRGMGMKIQIDFALAHSPKLLICDEATAGLDPMARAEVLDLLLDFVESGDRGVLFSSHITSDFDSCADTVVCIDKGRSIFSMPKDDITRLAGVAICSHTDLEELETSGYLSKSGVVVKRGTYNSEVLVPDRFEFSQNFPQIACEPASVEKYMFMVLGGERQ
ncbi:MAG: ABC transporter ATP-binding protein [Arcanobacterium sp.]|nr:ABC transporter ATP-binding protein [Arcanobacterium sp.]MDY5588572.1 ABC transporter ATP-binding protein [Arcanobacterium sp.]